MSVLRQRGFTLAELLMALLILGLIAAFTIPKILQTQQDARYNALAKESAGMVSGAFDMYKMTNTLTATTNGREITPFLNYVSLRTTGSLDSKHGSGSLSCSATNPCMNLHNGGSFRAANVTFSGIGTTNAVEFYFDPDGVDSGLMTGPSKSVQFFLYYNGRLMSRGSCLDGTVTSAGTFDNNLPNADPPWFSWNN